MRVRSSLLAVVMSGVVAAAAVAGCSSGSSSTAATPSETAAAVSAATTGAASTATSSATVTAGEVSSGANGVVGGGSAAPSGGPPAGQATCKQLTIAQVQPLVDDKLTSVTVTAPAGGGQQCTFKGADASLYVTVISGDLAAQTYASDVQSMDPATTVPGVGAKAVRGQEAALSSIDGSVYCSVRPADSGNVPGLAALMHAAGDSGNISPVAYQIAATALGTLCNRIYGTGNTTPDLSGIPKATAAPTS